LIGADYETTLGIGFGSPTPAVGAARFINPPPKTPRQALAMIKAPKSPPIEVAAAFAVFRELSGSSVSTFDIPAAEKWCADHQQKCDTASPDQKPAQK
jgi:hypothetical protein